MRRTRLLNPTEQHMLECKLRAYKGDGDIRDKDTVLLPEVQILFDQLLNKGVSRLEGVYTVSYDDGRPVPKMYQVDASAFHRQAIIADICRERFIDQYGCSPDLWS